MTFMSGLFHFAQQIAENKSQKITIKEKLIKRKSQEKIEGIQAKDWKKYLDVYKGELLFKQRRRGKQVLESLVDAGAVIQVITVEKEQLRIDYTLFNKNETILI